MSEKTQRAFRVCFTGGGTAGHVLPNLSIISLLTTGACNVYYIGCADRIEHGVMTAAGVRFFPIKCGKFRRYWSIESLADPFRLLFGLAQVVILFQELQPHVVFSKGGYVSLPVALAAWL